ncbi:MAG: hypothetical protein ACRDD1_15850, partial [Planctomycetia bacterium]
MVKAASLKASGGDAVRHREAETCRPFPRRTPFSSSTTPAAAVPRWLEARLAAEGRSVDVLAIDGKTLRGSRDGEIPGVHLPSDYAAQAGAVLAQVRVDAKTNERKAALELRGLLP